MFDRVRARLGNVRERAREVLRPGSPAGERGPAGHAPGSASQEGSRDSGGGGFHPPQRPPVHAVAPPTAPASTRSPVVVAAPVTDTLPAAAAVVVAVPVADPVIVAAPDAVAGTVAVTDTALVAAPPPAAPSRLLYADTSSTDVEAYRARALAAGRDPASITGKEGRNVAADGVPFWGPLDNESARAKAEGRLLSIDPHDCISCGTCVEQTEAVFQLPDDATAVPVAQDGPMDLIQDAIDACPVTCIHWVTREEARERGLTTGR